MQQVLINGLRLWQFENLTGVPSIKHFVTDRSSSQSEQPFTLSYTSSPDKALIDHNRQQLAAALGIGPEQLYFPSQVHKTRIVRVNGNTPKEDLLETDALISNERGICIAVMSADCVPILLYDRKNKAVGAVHSGWRGTVAKILEKTLLEMQANFGTRGEDVIASIGPSVCQDAYEVGEEVVQQVQQTFSGASGLLLPQPNNKAKLDLWQANKLQLLDFGVRDSQIAVSDLCTVKNNQHFFSARKGDSGRFAAGIMLV